MSTQFIFSLFFMIYISGYFGAIMVLSPLDLPTFLVLMGINAYILINIAPNIIDFLLQIVIELQILKP